MTKIRSIALMGVLAAGLPAAAHAGLVFGGGPKNTDCYAAFDVAGVTSGSAKGGRVVQCHDGDPCDTDGQRGNNSCTFSFTVCVLQAGDTSCQPADVDKLPKKSGGLSLPTVPAMAPACGAANEVKVKVNKHKTVRLTAHSKSTKPHVDRDVLNLECKKAAASPSGAFLDGED